MPYVEKDVSQDRAAAIEMVRKSGQQGVPVVDVDGQVVVGFDRARLERILSAREQGKVTLGAAVADASKIAIKRGFTPIFGAFVGRVTPGGPAQRAGLREGDIITRLGLRSIHNAEQVEQAMAGVKPGSRLAVEFVRGSQNLRSELAF